VLPVSGLRRESPLQYALTLGLFAMLGKLRSHVRWNRNLWQFYYDVVREFLAGASLLRNVTPRMM